jgi:hypothetical protein
MKLTKTKFKQIIKEAVKECRNNNEQLRFPSANFPHMHTYVKNIHENLNKMLLDMSESETQKLFAALTKDYGPNLTLIVLIKKQLEKTWKASFKIAELKQLNKYSKEEISIEDLYVKSNALLDIKDRKRTKAETKDLRRINFALQARGKGPKLIKIDC